MNYKDIFNRVEASLILAGRRPAIEQELSRALADFKQRPDREYTDDQYYQQLVDVIFYAGFRAATVTRHLPVIHKHFGDYRVVANYGDKEKEEILQDQQMIRNRQKVEKCCACAKRLPEVIAKLHQFHAKADASDPVGTTSRAIELSERLQPHLGLLTTLHLLMELGEPLLKPDRVLMRIFHRLGFLDSDRPTEPNVIRAVQCGAAIAREAGHPIRYVDYVFVLYGQIKANEKILENGICLEEKPRCHLCGVAQYCTYPGRPA